MSAATILLVVAPLFVAGVNMALWRHVRIQQVLGLIVLVSMLVASVAILAHVSGSAPLVVHIGGWPAPMGIVLVADALSSLLMVVAVATLLAVFLYAVGQPREDKGAFYFHSLYLILSAGVAASFLAGDLFNLFVAIEITLVSSYVLITLGGSRAQVRSGMTYVIINMVASTLLMVSIGLVYASTGTVNMADVAQKLTSAPGGINRGIGLLMFVAFGLKAAIFPLFFWLPDSYPTAPVTVTAVFSGLLTKIGMYGVLRTQTMIFPLTGASRSLVMFLAGATMIVGAIGALAQNDMKRVLSFSIVSQIGFIMFGLSINTTAGIAAAIFFLVHQIPVKTSLFLVSGLVETLGGSAAMDKVSGMMRRSPLTSVLFALSALSLIGVPPLSGFFGKLALVESGLRARSWILVGICLGVSVLTLIYLAKIWSSMFWGKELHPEPVRLDDGRVFEAPERAPFLMNSATVFLVTVTIAIAIGAEEIWRLSLQASTELMHPLSYVQAVLGT